MVCEFLFVVVQTYYPCNLARVDVQGLQQLLRGFVELESERECIVVAILGQLRSRGRPDSSAVDLGMLRAILVRLQADNCSHQEHDLAQSVAEDWGLAREQVALEHDVRRL